MRGQERENRKEKVPFSDTTGLHRLIKLQFLQKRFIYLGLLLMEFCFVIFAIITNLRERASLGGGIHCSDMSHMPQLGIVIVLVFLCLGGYDAVDNKHISMYPGTRKAKYLSRIILDVLFLFCFTVWLVFLYFASYGIYQVIHLVLPDVNLLYFFSWKYLFEGCTCFFALSVMMYGLIQLAYTIMYCLGRTGYLIVWGVGLFACALSAGMLSPVYHLLTKPLPWIGTVGAYALAGILSIMVSSGIVLWKKRPLRMFYGSAVLLFATAVIFELGLKLAIEYQDLEQFYDVAEEETNQDNQRIFKEFEVSWEEGDRMEFLSRVDWILPEKGEKDTFDNRLYPQVKICSVSDTEFQTENISAQSRIPEEKFVLRLEAVDGTYNGKPVYQEVLENIILKKENNQLYYNCKDIYYVLNLIFGEADKFTGSDGHNIWDWGKDGELSNGMYLKVIIDDETMKDWEKHQEAEGMD